MVALVELYFITIFLPSGCRRLKLETSSRIQVKMFLWVGRTGGSKYLCLYLYFFYRWYWWLTLYHICCDRYSAFVNWELWWPNFPILVYFKEKQTKPEGQIHFFPVIFVSFICFLIFLREILFYKYQKDAEVNINLALQFLLVWGRSRLGDSILICFN